MKYSGKTRQSAPCQSAPSTCQATCPAKSSKLSMSRALNFVTAIRTRSIPIHLPCHSQQSPNMPPPPTVRADYQVKDKRTGPTGDGIGVRPCKQRQGARRDLPQ